MTWTKTSPSGIDLIANLRGLTLWKGWGLSDTVASVAYQARADLPTFQKQNEPLLHVAGDLAFTIFCSLWTDDTLDLFVELGRSHMSRVESISCNFDYDGRLSIQFIQVILIHDACIRCTRLQKSDVQKLISFYSCESALLR